jgi:hypothetical protein
MMPLLFFFALVLAQGLVSLWQGGSNRLLVRFGKPLAILSMVVLLAIVVPGPIRSPVVSLARHKPAGVGLRSK